MKRSRLLVNLSLLILLLFPAAVSAQYTSSNYQANEVYFGTGGDPQTTSTNYQANQSAGGLAVGNVSSSNYQAYSGFLSPNEPFLSMIVSTSSVNLGTLSTSSASTGTANFQVTAYVNSGYTVQIASQPPSYTSGAGSHTLKAMTSLGSSTPGTEQFGINVVKNANFCGAGCDLGANPSPQPDSTFANGQAATGYNNPSQFKYNAGDTIVCSGTSSPCSSGSGWGETIYTISYIANVSLATPAGNYSAVQDLVIVATY